MNQAIRHILDVNMLTIFHLLKLKDIHETFVLKFTHSCIYGLHLEIFEQYFSKFLPTHSYLPRNKKIQLSTSKNGNEKKSANL